MSLTISLYMPFLYIPLSLILRVGPYIRNESNVHFFHITLQFFFYVLIGFPQKSFEFIIIAVILDLVMRIPT